MKPRSAAPPPDNETGKRTSGDKPSNRVPLERAMSKLGLASRSQARELIHDGRVRVNGKVITDVRVMIVPEWARIEIDDEVKADKRDVRVRELIVMAMNKPRGAVTTTKDPEGRPTVFDVLRAAGVTERMLAVGRLDRASTGLLLFTNDSQLANTLTDPTTGVSRRYVVTVRGRVEPETIGEMAPAEIEIRKASNRETHLFVTLTQGKNREIRKMFGDAGHEVTRLHRIAYGEVVLGELQPGQCRDVTESFVHSS
jgi:23S rRNA pseudouridine2605 synthase